VCHNCGRLLSVEPPNQERFVPPFQPQKAPTPLPASPQIPSRAGAPQITMARTTVLRPKDEDSAPAVQYDPNLALGAVIGSYRLTKILGGGSVGTVYLGEHIELSKRVAIKILKPELASEVEANSRFLTEAKLIARLRNPSIVDVYDYGFAKDLGRYLTMEYLEGETLDAYLKRHRRLSPYEAMSIGWQILDGLEVAHAVGIIHRDLKPANVHIERRGPNTNTKLLDFGIAKLLDPDAQEVFRTQIGTILGSPDYMAPEQAASEELDARADIYSFGVILFELVTGRRPFISNNPIKMMFLQQFEPAPSPSQFAPDLPKKLEQVILHCLQKVPDDRPQTVSVLKKELEALLTLLEKAPAIASETPNDAPAPNPTDTPPNHAKGATPEPPKANTLDLSSLRSLKETPPVQLEEAPESNRLFTWLFIAVGAGFVALIIVGYLIISNL
jgi:serine/threonine protein kinase